MKFKLLETSEIDTLKKITDQEELYNTLIKMLRSKNYEDTVDFIDDLVDDPKLRFILSLGFGGKFANLKLKLTEKVIPCIKLIPTQREIGLDETLKYVLSGKNLEKCFRDPAVIKKPIVTFQGTFIVDGHHRWSEIYATNPKANLLCIDISGNLSPIAMLKAVQATIGSNVGDLETKDVQGKNLFDQKADYLRKYIEKGMSQETYDFLRKYYDDPVNSIVGNCLELKINNTPILGAPKRGDMPQTGHDPELFSDLKKGITKI